MRILLVEDDPAISGLLQRYLGRNQHEVVAFASSPEALDAFRAQPYDFDVAITDLSLKDISGEELVQRFLELRPDIPVVIATGYSYSPSHLPLKVRARIHVLQKPFLPKQILEILTKVAPAAAATPMPVTAVVLRTPAAPVLAREFAEESARVAKRLRANVPA